MIGESTMLKYNDLICISIDVLDKDIMMFWGFKDVKIKNISVLLRQANEKCQDLTITKKVNIGLVFNMIPHLMKKNWVLSRVVYLSDDIFLQSKLRRLIVVVLNE